MNRSFAKSFWQLVAGGVCIAGGIVSIFLGWFGAAHTRDLTDQIPYLISGGLFGLALVVLGSALYFSHFISESARATRRSHRLLEAGAASALRGPLTPGDPSEIASVFTVPGGATYHRPGCPLAGGKQTTPHSPDQATTLGYAPCPVCEPANAN